jgi:hypothetical protein
VRKLQCEGGLQKKASLVYGKAILKASVKLQGGKRSNHKQEIGCTAEQFLQVLTVYWLGAASQKCDYVVER